jgi:hypothetical protein
VERLLSAAQARADAEVSRVRTGELCDEEYAEYGYGAEGVDGYERDEDDPYGTEGGALRPYRGRARWHRPVAWMLAVIMGIGMVALAFTAVYRGASGARQDQGPLPASTPVDRPQTNLTSTPSASAEYIPPASSVVPRTPG